MYFIPFVTFTGQHAIQSPPDTLSKKIRHPKITNLVFFGTIPCGQRQF